MSAPRTVLVTRPVEDAGPLARRIEALGHRALIEPLLTIRYLAARVDLSGVQALAFTSANGVRAFLHALGDRQPRALAVYAVGRATAAAARAAGFENVTAAGGDVDSLARLVRAEARPQAGAIVHVAGRDRVGDLAAALAPEGFDVRRVILYAADAATELSAQTVAALRTGGVDDVVIFSPRTARQFVTLIGSAGLRSEAARLRLLALSSRVAEAAGDIPFASVAIAARPDEDALIALLGASDIEGKSEPMPTDGETERPRQTAPAAAQASARPGRRGFVVFMLVLLALAVAAAIVVMTDPVKRESALALLRGAPEKTRPAVLRPIDLLGVRLDSLAAEVAALKSKPAPAAVDPAHVDDLARRTDALAARIGALEEKAKAPSVVAPPAMDRDTLALVALIAALDAGRPFAAHVARARAALSALGPDSAERVLSLGLVDAWANKGVPTAAMLAARCRMFSPERPVAAAPSPTLAAATPVAATPVAMAPDGLWERMKARISGLVTVRRIGEKPPATNSATGAGPAAGDSDAQALARAADLFAAGDVAAALALLRAIDGKALASASAEALGALIADGAARIAADRVAGGPLGPVAK